MAATGILSAPLDALADLVAASATFQTWVGAANAAAAKPRVYRSARDGSGGSGYTRPFALAVLPAEFGVMLTHGSFASGAMDVLFEADIASGDLDSHEDAGYEFANKIGAIIDEMMAASYGGGYLFVRKIEQVAPPARAENIEQSDYYQAWYRVHYGLEA